MNIEELLPYIEKRPQMYFREKSVFFLETFLGGFFSNENHKDDFRYDFYNWLQKKFNLENNLTWADYIFKISQNENMNSVDIFFREYYLFKKENK